VTDQQKVLYFGIIIYYIIYYYITLFIIYYYILLPTKNAPFLKICVVISKLYKLFICSRGDRFSRFQSERI